MAADALETMTTFWETQDRGDWDAVAALFADDAVVVDPLYGTFEGRDAIDGFFSRVSAEMAEIGATFRLVDLAADGEVAWAEWEATTDRGDLTGAGLYRARDGRITYYRDHIDR
ncbi:nuclear transport factor 2 family protein [Ilumatobacter sp.]|uniref:nuclear transport factor 2 family protein n=1 Tax=Ilumatobacter sp. TaxID=1967498 RepID=UPI003B51E055